MTEPPQPFNRPYGQPPEGQGPYGPPPGQFGPPPGQFGPPPPPARKSRVVLYALIAGLVLVLVAGGIVLARALGPILLDHDAVERDVAAQFEEVYDVAVELDCPNIMRVDPGAEYTCEGETSDGQEVEIAIQIADPADDADYTWSEI